MTKADLVERVADAVGSSVTKRECALMVDAVLDAVKEALARGDGIELRGFGTFKVRHRKARTGRNPRTGEVVEGSGPGCAGVQTVKAPPQPGGVSLQRVSHGRTLWGPLTGHRVAHSPSLTPRRLQLGGSQGAQPPASPAVIPWVSWLVHLNVGQASAVDTRETLHNAARNRRAVAGQLPGLVIVGLTDGKDRPSRTLRRRGSLLRAPVAPYPRSPLGDPRSSILGAPTSRRVVVACVL